MFGADVTDFSLEFDFLEDADDFRFTESGFLHAEISVVWILSF